MVLDTSRSSTSTATLAATRATIPPADPWDAPYFGGTVYFSYQPTLPARPATHTAVATKDALTAGAREDGGSMAATGGALPADPWDAPYFGGPVYFRYPDFPVTSFGSAAVLPALAELAGVAGERPSAGDGEQSPGAARSETGAALPVTPQGDKAVKRRGWLARFFRGELYIGRRV